MKCIQFILQALLVLSSSGWGSCAQTPKDFALGLYRELANKNRTENVLVAPIDVWEAMNMVLLGAARDTKTQLLTTLGHDPLKSDVAFKEESKKNLDILNKKDDTYTVNLANRLFVSKAFDIKNNYKSDSEKYFGSTPESLDFENKADKSLRRINDWVSSQTDGKIDNLIPSGSIDERTQLVIASAIYLKALWKYPFDPKATETGQFRITKEERVQVDLMHLRATTLKYYDSPAIKSQILELPYQGDTLSMVIALPHDGVTVSNVVKDLTAKTLIDELDKVKARQVKVTLPKFTIEQSSDLKGVLQSMGIKDVFNTAKSDLSGISGHGRLYVTDVQHKTVIEVTESGTEAAAATDAIVGMTSVHVDPKDLIEFKADRPFLFLIRAKDASLPLFCGHVLRLPRKD